MRSVGRGRRAGRASDGDDQEDAWPGASSTLTSMANLSFTWKAIGRQTKALKLMDECVKLRKQVLGVNHLRFLSSSAASSAWQLKGEG
jgi:Tetratricopeptide repeat